MHRGSFATLTFLVIALLTAAPAWSAPTVFTVDTAAQRSSAGDVFANCTLGDAIVAANRDSSIDACTHPNIGTGGPFEIVLPAGMGPFVLDRSENGLDGPAGFPPIRSAVTIFGNGNSIERNAGFSCPGAVAEQFRIFDVAFGKRLVLESLDVLNGCAPHSGAIRNEGQLLLLDSSVSDSTAFQKDGGGIQTFGGNVELVDSSVFNNQAEKSGGGINNRAGVLVLRRSSVIGNAADFGGGIHTMIGQATLMNSTISGNLANSAGGIANSGGGNLTLIGTTISRNKAPEGPGITHVIGGMSFTNSILVDRCFFASSPGNVDAGHNLERLSTCGLNAATSLFDVPPMLGPLQDNGGPTLTHALLAGSPALDAGNDGACATPGSDGMDQRGVARPDGDPNGTGSCDMGAVEFIDCDANDFDDGSEIAAAPGLDGDANGVLDACEDSPPVANAGRDQTLECSSSGGSEVALDGSGSSDPDGSTLSFRWTGSFGTVEGEMVSVLLPTGSETIGLEVMDATGNLASDELQVTVEDTLPPSATASLEREHRWSNWSRLRVHVSCSDRCDPVVPVLASVDGMPVADGDLVKIRGWGRWHAAPMLTVQCVDTAGNATEASAEAPPRLRRADLRRWRRSHWNFLKKLHGRWRAIWH